MLVACGAELTSGNYLETSVTLKKSDEIAFLFLFVWLLLGIFNIMERELFLSSEASNRLTPCIKLFN